MDALAKVCPKCGRRYDTAAAFCQKCGLRLQLVDEEEPDHYIGTTLLDQFKIEEKIGAGGMGSVYRARQTTLHRDVAIKILHPELADNRDAVRRFKREARVCTALDHPNVVRVFLFGQLPDGSLYIVMEFLRGRSLLDVIGREGALPVHRALHISAQICDGVGEAHAHGVVHRDIKPENIVLVAKSRDPDYVKVLDFGIARVLWGDDQTQATQSGLVFGTARYISPEGAAGEATDARSDVYSLGVLTYQLLCGETPFDAPSPVAMLMKHIHTTPPHLLSNERARHVPEPVADVVMRALTKNPEGRYEDAAAFGEALRVAAQNAGFEVNARRSISTSIAPPSKPELAAARPAESSRDDETDRVRTESRAKRSTGDVERDASADLAPSRPPDSSTLSAAPSPFGESEDVSIPGLRTRPKKKASASWRVVGVAFVVGVMLVSGGFAVAHWLRGPTIVEERTLGERWADEARTALERGHYDEPREGSVLELTDRLLEGDASDPLGRELHRTARELRRSAAERLVDRAEEEAERGDREQAIATYERARAFTEDDAQIDAAIAELREPPLAPDPPGVRTDPLHIIEGREIRLIATLEAGVEIGQRAEPPRFVIKRGSERTGAPILATAIAGGRTFEARHTITTPGTYRLIFRIGTGADRIEMDTEIEVARDPDRPVRPRIERDPPPVTTQGSSWTPPTIAPAWTNTPVITNAPPPPPPQPDPPPPPAPWSSGGTVF